MCCEGTAVRLKLPEDGVNKQCKAQQRELIWERRNSVLKIK